MKKYLVTGGAGFIGSNIVERLVSEGKFVRVIDNYSTGKKENLSAFQKDIEIVEGDIRDKAAVNKALKHIDVVFHQAALPSVPRSIADPITSNEVNINGTLNILWGAKEIGVKRIVFASSSSVYGDTPELPKHEGMKPNPLSPYAVNKLAGEAYCKVFANVYGLETVALRYFNVFGPRQDPASQYAAVIPKFIRAMLNDESPTIYGDGEQSRDFTYITNVVNANLLAGEADVPKGIVMNCACQDRATLNELVSLINKYLGKNIQPLYTPPAVGDIKHSLAAIELAKQSINYQPSISFAEGVQLTIESLKRSL